MNRQFTGVFIPAEIWTADYKTFEEREMALFTYIVQEYGIEVATAGGFKNAK
jgi:hypothetical protein